MERWINHLQPKLIKFNLDNLITIKIKIKFFY